MELRPPPATDNIEDLREWCLELYRFLERPSFESVKYVPRSSEPDTEKGVVYYDSDDDKLKAHNGTAFQDTY
jgi:hypothetical protein